MPSRCVERTARLDFSPPFAEETCGFVSFFPRRTMRGPSCLRRWKPCGASLLLEEGTSWWMPHIRIESLSEAKT